MFLSGNEEGLYQLISLRFHNDEATSFASVNDSFTPILKIF